MILFVINHLDFRELFQYHNPIPILPISLIKLDYSAFFDTISSAKNHILLSFSQPPSSFPEQRIERGCCIATMALSSEIVDGPGLECELIKKNKYE